MIRLYSTPTDAADAILAACEARRQHAIASGMPVSAAVRSCYRRGQVKDAIREDTHDKCAYCELKITGIYWGDIEHIVPKEKVPEKSLSYDNLTLACAICNNCKSDYFDPAAPILNPYLDEPDTHIVAFGPFLFPRNGSAIGRRTIDLLDLNRLGLPERRLDRVQSISELVDRYVSLAEGPLKRVIRRQLISEVGDDKEHALAARWFLRITHNLDWQAL